MANFAGLIKVPPWQKKIICGLCVIPVFVEGAIYRLG